MNDSPADEKLLVKVLHVGEMAACCYLAGAKGGEGMIIDPGDEAARIVKSVGLMGITVKRIVCTHAHADHIGALDAVREHYPEAEFAIHGDDAPMLERPSLNLSFFLGGGFKCNPPDRLLKDGDKLEVAGVNIDVIHIPGHTPGGICLHVPRAGMVFTGDVLFADGIGRTDFPGGDYDLLITGIREKLLTLPPKTVVYPGHGPSSTIGREKAGNPFLS